MTATLVREPWWASALRDALRLVLLIVIVVAVSAAVVLPPQVQPLWLDVFGRALSGVSAELVVLLLLRALVPTARVGSHRVGWNRNYLRWLASSTLNEVAFLPWVRAPFAAFEASRMLYLQALGARISWTASLASSLTVRDPSLCVIEDGVQVEDQVTIETALHGAGRVRIGRVEVGPGCLVGAHALVMPGVVLAPEARVGPRTVIGENAQIGVCVAVGAGATVGSECDVGSYASIGAAAVVGTGSRIGDRARIADAARLAAETTVHEREVWNGG